LDRSLVGRDDELDAVAGVLRGLEELPGAVVVCGEAGIGKTSLWSAGLDAAETHGYRVLRTRPAEAETGFAFAGLTDLLEGAAGCALAELPSMQRRAIETALLLREAEIAIDERAVASAFLGALRILAREGPVLVAIDDLQWLDSATLATVRFALARLDHECVAALFAVRGPTPEWLRRGLPEHRLVTVEVGRLSLGATSRMILERVTTRLSRPVAVRIHDVAGGNPFYALELARALQRRDGKLDSAGELPLSETLAELVALRLDGLTPAALLAARVAASTADPTVTHVEAVLGAEADAALAGCLAAGVLELDGFRARLVHPLLGSAIRSRSTPAELRAVHLRLAGLTVTEEQRARHLALSTREPDEGIATVLDQEAASALRRGATATAAELAELAVRLTPPGDPITTWRRVLAFADRLCEVGDYERATALLEQLLADAPPGGSRGRVLMRLAGIRNSSTGPYEAQELYRQALTEVSGDPELQTEVLLKMAELARFTSDRETGLELARRAVRSSTGTDDRTSRCRALAIYGLMHFSAGLGVAAAEMEEALELERSFPSKTLPTEVLIYQQFWSGQVDGARELQQAQLESALARADPDTTAYYWFLALVEWRAGNWELASHHAEELATVREQAGREWLWAVDEYPGAVLAAHRGLVDDARARARGAIAAAEKIGQTVHQAMHHHVLGFLELSQGDAATALSHLRLAARYFEAGGLREPGMRTEIGDLLEALVASGENAEAEEVLRIWEDRARHLDRAWALAVLARCRGLLSAASGDTDRAFRDFEQALGEHARCPDPFQQARTMLALGRTQRRAKQRGAARVSINDALARFERLGAPLWAAQARDELGRIGGRPPNGAQLTESEQRIAHLVAQGKANREVAASLFLTVHSVETALTNIYRKLGIRSRTELASRYAART
jgi:DNA-binding CsgD family transcriptional regulator